MKKHKKIYYVAGIISALLVPLLFLYYVTPVYNKMNMRVMDVGLLYKTKKGEKVSEFNQIPTKGWKYKTISVKPAFDQKTEDYFTKEIKTLKINNIDQTGIRFQFSDKNVYADIIGLLNIMLKTKQEMYGLDMDKTNSLYVLYKKPDKTVERFGCGSNDNLMYLNMDHYNYETASFWKKLIYYSPKESYYLIFGFLLLVYCAMLRPKLTFNI